MQNWAPVEYKEVSRDAIVLCERQSCFSTRDKFKMVRSLRLYGNTFVYHDSFQAMNGTRLNSLCSAVRMNSVLVVLSALLFLGGGEGCLIFMPPIFFPYKYCNISCLWHYCRLGRDYDAFQPRDKLPKEWNSIINWKPPVMYRVFID